MRGLESHLVTSARRARMLEIRNSNLEIRNKFKARNSNDRNTDIKSVLNFRHLDFGFVSDFEIRIWLRLCRVRSHASISWPISGDRKSEARNPKQIRNLNLKCQKLDGLRLFDIRALNLFRISCFGFERQNCATYFCAAPQFHGSSMFISRSVVPIAASNVSTSLSKSRPMLPMRKQSALVTLPG